MFGRRPYKRAKPNSTTTHRVTGTRTQHAGRGRILARHTQRRAPRDVLTPAVWDYQPGAGCNIWVGKIADCGRVQTVGRIIDDIFRGNTVITRNTIQAFASLPFMVGP